MAKKLTGALILVGTPETCPDLEYATRFRSADVVILVQKDGRKYLTVPEIEAHRAAAQCPDLTVFTPGQLGVRKPRPPYVGTWALATLRKLQIQAVSIPVLFPHGVARQLQKAGIKLRISPRTLFPERLIKKPDEVRHVRQSQQAAVIAMRTATAIISHAEIDKTGMLRTRHGPLTSEQIRSTISRILLNHNCLCREIIAAGGQQSADPHEQGSGQLPAHQPIVIDIFPKHLEHGYWGDLTRTVVKGSASPRLKKMYQAVKAAQTAALNKVRPGVKCSTVHHAASAEFTRRRYKTETVDGRKVGFTHSIGHGVGLSIHEEPRLTDETTRLKTGNVITIEPGLYYPHIGGIRIEDTIVVTPTGWRYLVPCEKKFEL